MVAVPHMEPACQLADAVRIASRVAVALVCAIGCPPTAMGATSGPESCQAIPPGSPFRVLCDPASFSALVHVPGGEHALPLPVLLYLHGRGQSGEDLSITLEPPATGGPPAELHHGRAVEELATSFVMVAPQTSRGWQTQRLGDFLDFLLGAGQESLGVRLDPARVYITGHSIGGTAAMQAAADLRAAPSGARRFAAVVPVAPTFLRSYQGLKGVPVWLHHGANDIVAAVGASDHAASALRALNPGEDTVRYTRYEHAPTAPGRNPATHAGHASPILVYNNSEVYWWLLRHHVAAL